VRHSGDSTTTQKAYDPDVSKLKKAVEEEDLGELVRLLKGEVNVNYKDGSFAETTLHKAVMVSTTNMRLSEEENRQV